VPRAIACVAAVLLLVSACGNNEPKNDSQPFADPCSRLPLNEINRISGKAFGAGIPKKDWEGHCIWTAVDDSQDNVELYGYDNHNTCTPGAGIKLIEGLGDKAWSYTGEDLKYTDVCVQQGRASFGVTYNENRPEKVDVTEQVIALARVVSAHLG
jgi:hypothetical protein